MTNAEFYEKYKEFLHDAIEVMFSGDRSVMEWYDLRNDKEIVILWYFAGNLSNTLDLFIKTLLQQTVIRQLNLEKMTAEQL